MNRKARRGEKTKGRKAHTPTDISIAAVHEAAHAVAMLLTIGERGYGTREAIAHIEMHPDQSGVTYKHMFSRDIEEGSAEFKRTYISERGTPCGADVHSFLTQIVQCGRAAGANIDRWFRARTLNAISGSIAEAIYSDRSFYQVWLSDHAMRDRLRVAEDVSLADMPAEQINEVFDRMAALSAHVMQKSPVWTAVLKLAKALPVVGRMSGSKAVSCIGSVIPLRDRATLFAESIFYIHDIETIIDQADLVVAAGPFNPLLEVIKGRKVFQEAVRCGRKIVQGVTINCERQITAETLWRVFGDGALRLGESEEVQTSAEAVNL
jgi:hypothetical protein